jgi:type I restriction-modification system DNA methylase subunit
MSNSDIAQKLWNLCDVLRDDGTNYSDYVTELVLLLFIKMARPVFFNDRCLYGEISEPEP